MFGAQKHSRLHQGYQEPTETLEEAVFVDVTLFVCLCMCVCVCETENREEIKKRREKKGEAKISEGFYLLTN